MEHLRAFLEAAPDPMVLVDGRGGILVANHQAETMFGYAQGSLVGLPVEALMPERFRRRHEAHRATYTSEPRVRPMGAGLELFGIRKDGTEFPIEISLSPIEQGGRRLTLAALRDVTERRREAEELRAARVARPLVRRIVRELVDRTGADRSTLHAVGESLAREAEAVTLADFIRAFDEMGLGHLSQAGVDGGRHRFVARDLLERREGARLTTCFLTVGYLSGAVSRTLGTPALGTEVACQSRGDPQCEFVVQARPVK